MLAPSSSLIHNVSLLKIGETNLLGKSYMNKRLKKALPCLIKDLQIKLILSGIQNIINIIQSKHILRLRFQITNISHILPDNFLKNNRKLLDFLTETIKIQLHMFQIETIITISKRLHLNAT